MLTRVVQIKGWTELCKHSEAAVTPVVREFYADLCGEKYGKVFFRGKWVPFDIKVINEHYKLAEENYDQFKSLCNNLNYDMILECLIDNRV